MNVGLSDRQKLFYDLFGYLVIPGLMADVIEEITDEFEATFAKYSDETRVRTNFIDDNARLRGLLDDPRIDAIPARLLGEDYSFQNSTGSLFAGDTDWHPNRAPKPYRYNVVAMYLDPVGPDTGALRVIPGSHKPGQYREEVMPIVAGHNSREGLDYLDAEDLESIAIYLAQELEDGFGSGGQPGRYLEALGLSGPDIPAAILTSEPGDVVIMDESILHSAWGGSGRKRQLRFGFAEHCTDEHLPTFLKHLIQTRAPWGTDHVYSGALVSTADERRMRHLAQPLACSDQIYTVVHRLRELMPERFSMTP